MAEGVPIHVFIGEKLKQNLEARRQGYLETMAKGQPTDQYMKLVGRADECRLLLTELDELLKKLGDEDDYDEDTA
jgi:hypothetical protein